MSVGAYVDGIGVLGPGLADWAATADILMGRSAYSSAPTQLPNPMLLPPAERRRTGRLVKLALAAATEAAAHAGANTADLRSIFASSSGDGHNSHEICEALAQGNCELSPTRFANSVHNAASGYWGIATGSEHASNVLCAYDASFSAGLLEALTQVTVDAVPVLLVAYDSDYPQPLRAVRAVPDAFAIALILSPQHSRASRARIDATLGEEAVAALDVAPLEALRTSIPAARGLPLLVEIAGGAHGRTVLEYLDGTNLVVRVESPCA
jgi:hypothetical protein